MKSETIWQVNIVNWLHIDNNTNDEFRCLNPSSNSYYHNSFSAYKTKNGDLTRNKWPENITNSIFIVKLGKKSQLFVLAHQIPANKILADQTSPIRYRLIKTAFTFILQPKHFYNNSNKQTQTKHRHKDKSICHRAHSAVFYLLVIGMGQCVTHLFMCYTVVCSVVSFISVIHFISVQIYWHSLE